MQDRVEEEPGRDQVALPGRLVAELVHAVQLADRGHRRQQPGQLGVLADVALAEEDAALGIEPGGEQDRRGVVDALAQLGRVVGHRDRVQVDDAVDGRIAAVLAGDVLRDRPDVVAQVLAARGLDSREDAHGGARYPCLARARRDGGGGWSRRRPVHAYAPQLSVIHRPVDAQHPERADRHDQPGRRRRPHPGRDPRDRRPVLDHAGDSAAEALHALLPAGLRVGATCSDCRLHGAVSGAAARCLRASEIGSYPGRHAHGRAPRGSVNFKLSDAPPAPVAVLDAQRRRASARRSSSARSSGPHGTQVNRPRRGHAPAAPRRLRARAAATDPSGLQRTRSTRCASSAGVDARYSGWRMTGRLAAPASSRRRTGVV